MRSYIYLRMFLLLILTLSYVETAASSGGEPWYINCGRIIDSLKQHLNTRPITEKREMELCRDISTWYGAFELDSSIFYAYKGVPIAKKLNDHVMLMDLYNCAGVALCFKGDYEEAFECYDRVTELALKHKSKKMEAHAIAMVAFAYAKQGKFNTSIDYYLKYLKMTENEGWKHNSVTTYVNLSEINRKIGNTESAMQYLKQADELCKELNVPDYNWRMPQIYNEYASNYMSKGSYDEALRYALKADSLNPDVGMVNRCQTKRLLATIYLHWNDYDRALQYAKESYREADVLKDVSLYTIAGKILSDVYLAQKRYPEAEAEAKKVWIADSTNIDESRTVVENIVLANIYMHKTDMAAYYLKKYTELNEQYTEKSFHTILSDLSLKYDIDKKEMRISALEQRRNLNIVISVIGVLLAIITWVVSWQKIRRERMEKQLVATKAVLEWEKKERKRFASDLHDGINGMLSAVKIELDKGENLHDIRDKIDECITTIRRMAHSMMPVSLDRYGIKAALEDYCQLFPNVRFHFFGEDRRVDEKIELTLYYCAFELVNNSIKHSGAENIDVQLIQDDDHISLAVQDDGCGFDIRSTLHGSGLKNLRDRVAAINGEIDIATSKGKGIETHIELRIERDKTS